MNHTPITMPNLTIRAAITCRAAIQSFDGRVEPVMDKDGALVGKKILDRPVFGSLVRLRLALALRLLAAVSDDFEAAKKQILTDHTPEPELVTDENGKQTQVAKEFDPNSAEGRAAQDDLNVLLDQPAKLTAPLPKFTVADFDLDKNKTISLDTLALLAPVLPELVAAPAET